MLKSDLEKIINDREKFYGTIDKDFNAGNIPEEIYSGYLDDWSNILKLKKELESINDNPNVINSFINKKIKSNELDPVLFTTDQLRQANEGGIGRTTTYGNLADIIKKYTGKDKIYDEDLAAFIDPNNKNSWYQMTGTEYSNLAKDLGISQGDLSNQLQLLSTNEDRKQKAFYKENSKDGYDMLGKAGNFTIDIGYPSWQRSIAEGTDYTPKKIIADVALQGTNFIPEVAPIKKLATLGRTANLGQKVIKLGKQAINAGTNVGLQEGGEYGSRTLGGNSDISNLQSGIGAQVGLRAIGGKFLTKSGADLLASSPLTREAESLKGFRKTIEDLGEGGFETSKEALNKNKKDIKINQKDYNDLRWTKVNEINKLSKLKTLNELESNVDNRALQDAYLKEIDLINSGKTPYAASKITLKNAIEQNRLLDTKDPDYFRVQEVNAYNVNKRLIDELTPIINSNKMTAEPTVALAKHYSNLEAETGYKFPVGEDAKWQNRLIQFGRPIGTFGREHIERTGLNSNESFNSGLPNQMQTKYEKISEKNDRYNKGAVSIEEISKTKEEEDKLPVNEAKDKRNKRWKDGYATWEEQQTPEYKEYMSAKLQSLRGK